MVWTFEKTRIEVFPRNPISTVVVELRFQPIISIETTDSRVAEFQDRVRSLFPTYSVVDMNDIRLESGSVDISKKRAFEFGNVSGTRKIRLTSTGLSWISTDHLDRSDMISEFQTGIRALLSVFGGVETVRFGILYSNLVDKKLIASDCHPEIAWGDLIRPEYFPVSSDKLENGRLFWTQLWDSVEGDERSGDLAVRYGLQKQDTNSYETFRLDLDRSISGTNIPVDNSAQIINSFADDIYRMFFSMANSKLIEWMRSDGDLSSAPDK